LNNTLLRFTLRGVEIDRDSDVPVGVQLAWQLRARIGALQAGDRLPGVRDLAAEIGVNVNTVRAVYARLEAEGLVSSEHGRGTFVSGNAGADLRIAGIVERAAREARDAGLDPREVAAALYVNREGEEHAVRRALREEIAALERRLADPRLQRIEAAEGATPPETKANPVRAGAVPGGRILSVDELRALRDDLAERVSSLEAADRATVTVARDEASRATLTRAEGGRPRVRWTLQGES
jgi:DNA-binding transcriptional regulator YhcF (GntR family)